MDAFVCVAESLAVHRNYHNVVCYLAIPQYKIKSFLKKKKKVILI